MKSIKDYFKEQLKICNPISEEVLPELKGRSLYTDYEVNDEVVSFICQELGEVEPPYTEPSITLTVHSIVERDFDKFKNDYKFIRMIKTMPVFERRKNA